MQRIKAIADRYRIQKILFKVNNYLFARSKQFFYKVFDKHTLDHVTGFYVYENEEPGQILKMLLQKFSNNSKTPNLIFPSSHVKDNLQDKSVSIFFMKHHIVPFSLFTERQYEKIDIGQMLKMAYDGFCSLHYLHSHDIIHGNISLNSCYMVKNGKQIDMALSILDSTVFQQDLIRPNEVLIFRSQSQQNGLKTSFKDDAESMIFIILHLVSKGKMLSKQRFSREWINQTELLRWKTMDFFKQMIEILPPQLQYLAEIYTNIKSLSRNQKPDYPKFIKKAQSKLNNFQMLHKNNSQKSETASHQFNENTNSLKPFKKNLQNFQQIKNRHSNQVDQEEIQLLLMDSDNQNDHLQSKFSKLQSTKCTVKIKNFWDQKVELQE